MADIVLKNRNGVDVQYPGVERIKVNTVDGEVAEFVNSATLPEVVENVPIELDFSAGDQALDAPDGMLIKSAFIQKPDTLIPENIAEGVNIAGIVGALAGGGGAKILVGSYSPTGAGVETITHGLGVVPDMILVWSGVYNDSKLSRAFGVTTAIKNMFTGYSTWPSYYLVGTAAATAIKNTVPITGMENRTVGPDIHNVTAESFSVGSATYPLITGYSYHWIAIGGLT